MTPPEDGQVSEQGQDAGDAAGAEETAQDESIAFDAVTEEDKAEEAGVEFIKDDAQEAGEADDLDAAAAEKETAEADRLAKETADKAAAEGDDKATDEKDAKDDLDDEDDEVLARGKELIEKREAAEKEAADDKAAEETGAAPGSDKDPVPATKASYTPENVELFASVIPETLLPDTVTLKDGTELDFKRYSDIDPEAPIMAAAIAHNMINQMIESGQLARGSLKDDVSFEIKNALFMRTLTNKTYGVPDAEKIHSSPEFVKWYEGQPETIKELMASDSPHDRIMVYKRFIGSAGKDAADKKIADLDAARKGKKDKFDGVHKSTSRKTQTKTDKSVLDGQAEMQAAFDEEDDEDKFFTR